MSLILLRAWRSICRMIPHQHVHPKGERRKEKQVFSSDTKQQQTNDNKNDNWCRKMRTPGGLHTSLSALFLFFFSFHNNNKKDIFLIDVWKQSSLSLSLSFSWFFASSLAGWRPLSPQRIPKKWRSLDTRAFCMFRCCKQSACVTYLLRCLSLSLPWKLKKNYNEDDVSVSRKWRRQWGPGPFAASPPAGSHCSFVLAYS